MGGGSEGETGYEGEEKADEVDGGRLEEQDGKWEEGICERDWRPGIGPGARRAAKQSLRARFGEPCGWQVMQEVDGVSASLPTSPSRNVNHAAKRG